jgi:ParB family chromosome partitioning protein
MTYGQNPFHEEKAVETTAVFSDGDRIIRVAPELISVNPKQPRTHFAESSLNDLAESIRQHGIISPLIVTRQGEGFELIAGERRWRSAKLIGLKEVPVIVRAEKEQKKLELAIIENLQRENLNPLETAFAYRRLMDEFNITQEEAAKRVGKARSSVANALRLLSLPPEIQAALAEGKISEAHAKYLLGIEGAAKQVNMLKKIMRQNLTVAATDKEIKRLGSTKAVRTKDYFDRSREEELAEYLATKVEIRRQKKGGQLLIDFYSEEELNEILKKISGKRP